MRKIFAILFLMVGVASISFAQTDTVSSHPDAVIKGSSKALSEKHTDHFKNHLKLTDEQIPQVIAIYTTHFDNAKALHQEHKGKGHHHVNGEMDPVRKATDAEMKKVLTADQYKKYEHHVAKMRKHEKHTENF